MKQESTLTNTSAALAKPWLVDSLAIIGLQMTRILKGGLLFSLFLVCACALLFAHNLRRSLPAPAPRELFAIVNEQLIAFRSADFRGAYHHAAIAVQQKFTLPQFEKMVRQNYSEMTRAQRVEFGVVRMQGESASMQVFVFADDGSLRAFLYSFTNEGDSWKIDGVEELARDRSGHRLAGTHA